MNRIYISPQIYMIEMNLDLPIQGSTPGSNLGDETESGGGDYSKTLNIVNLTPSSTDSEDDW